MEHWVQIYSNQKDPVLKAALPASYAIYSNSLPLLSLTFYGPSPHPPRFTRLRITRVSSDNMSARLCPCDILLILKLFLMLQILQGKIKHIVVRLTTV